MRELSELPWPAPVGQLEEEPPVKEQGDLPPWTQPEQTPPPLTSLTQSVVLHLLHLHPKTPVVCVRPTCLCPCLCGAFITSYTHLAFTTHVKLSQFGVPSLGHLVMLLSIS